MDVDGVIPFRVQERTYQIPLRHIQNFPLQDALVNKLVEKYLDQTLPVKLSPCGEILIDLPTSSEELTQLDLNNTSEVSCTRHNFEKIIRIYANPKITMFELLGLEDMLIAAHSATGNHQINQSPDDVFDTDPHYNFLRQATYENFLQELTYYGLDSLFRSPLAETGIDQEEMIKTFEKNLEPYFGQPNPFYVNIPDSSATSRVKTFIHTVMALGGIFSGSALLQAILGEDWGEHKPTDLDVYVNEAMLQGMLLFSGRGFKKYRPLEEQASKLERELRTKLEAEGKSELEIKAATSMPLSRLCQAMQDLDKSNEEATRKDLADSICQALQASSATVTQPGHLANYNYSSQIIYVIKIVMPQGLKVDIIVLRSTVPYHIDRSFDFDFCKIYYDGYALHALNWDAIIKRCSLDLERKDPSYLSRIKRIEKYLRRGFIVLAPDTSAYRHSLEPRLITRVKLPVDVDIDPPVMVVLPSLTIPSI